MVRTQLIIIVTGIDMSR